MSVSVSDCWAPSLLGCALCLFPLICLPGSVVRPCSAASSLEICICSPLSCLSCLRVLHFGLRAHVRQVQRGPALCQGPARDQQLWQRHSRHSEWNCLAPRACFPLCFRNVDANARDAWNGSREALFSNLQRVKLLHSLQPF